MTIASANASSHATIPHVTTPDPGLPSWSGVLCVEGEWTGDGRIFNPGALYWENLPLPLRWAAEDYGQHQGAKHVGTIASVTRQGNNIAATGTAFDPEFLEYVHTVGSVGVSIDPDSVEFTIEVPEDALADLVPGVPAEMPQDLQRFSKARIRAATVVDIPALIDATLSLDAQPTTEQLSLAAAVAAGPTHAGIVLQAADTGRVLMLQRSMAVDDPNAGLWEFPGGGLDPGEKPEDGAAREFAEETGVPLPADAELCCSVVSPDGVYQAFQHIVPTEASMPLDTTDVINPDDPDSDQTEALAFWAPEHVLESSSPIRPEVPATLAALMQEDDEMSAAVAIGQGSLSLGSGALAVGDAPPVTEPDAPPAPSGGSVSDDDKTFLTAFLKLHEQEQQALSDYVSNADPNSPVAEFAAGVLDDTNDEIAQINGWLGNTETPAPVPTAADSLAASAAPVAPPAEWFECFDLDGPTPLTITADGRVYGHLATWDTCHRGPEFGNVCVTPPHDPTPDWFYNNGEVMTADGSSVEVGVITVGGGHAPRDQPIMAAIEHYDNVASQAAVVRVHEDEYGIGLFGALTADATPEMVATMRRSPLSGDWRKEGGKFRLIAAHAVNTPGFPISRGLVASVRRKSFITTGRVERQVADKTDLRSVADRIARQVGLDRESLVAGYAERVFGTPAEYAARIGLVAVGD